MKLARSARTALLAAMEMAAADGEPVTVAEVAGRHGLSPTALAKVLQQMVRAGLAVGSRGVGGGYRLARDASEVSVASVLSAFEPPPAAPGPPPGDPVEARLHALLQEVDETARCTLASVTLATLARGPEVLGRPTPYRTYHPLA